MIVQPDLVPINDKEYVLRSDTKKTVEMGYIQATWSIGVVTHRLTILERMVTDVASIPRYCWFIIGPPDGLYRLAAVFHDYVYCYRGHFIWDEHEISTDGGKTWTVSTEPLTKADADNMFLELMLRCGVDPGKAKTMYNAVKIFGRFAW